MMAPAQVEQLRARREEIARSQAALLALPDEKRRGPRGGLSGWSMAISEAGKAIEMLDRAIAKATPCKAANKRGRATRTRSPLDDGIVLVRVARGPTQELRVSARTWKGVRIVDVRLWLKNAAGFVPSRKGFAIEPEHLDAVIEALRVARQHV